MPRKSSVILSPAEKKAQVAALRADIKQTRSLRSEANKQLKLVTREFNAADKALSKLQTKLEALTAKAA